MKHPRFSKDREFFKVTKFVSKKLKSFLDNIVSTIFFYDIVGSTTSSSIYFTFRDLAHKDMCIRISNHISNNNFYNTENCYNIIVSDTNLQNININEEFMKILNWIECRETYIKDNLEIY